MSRADSDRSARSDSTVVVFLPSEINSAEFAFLHGDIELCDSSINFYMTGTCAKCCENCIGFYSSRAHRSREKSPRSRTWIHLRRHEGELALSKLNVNGSTRNPECHKCVVIYYDRKIFIESRNSLLTQVSDKMYRKDHFRTLIEKLQSHRKECSSETLINYYKRLCYILRFVVLCMSFVSKAFLKVAKCSNIAVHIDNYLSGFIWVTDSEKKGEREDIKKLNFLLSVFIDMICGALFLNWLTSQVSPESFPKFFLLTTENIVDSLRDLIHWLTGDPAGFKFNFTFSKILATFSLFYIDMWAAFIALIKPAYKVIFVVFLVLGKVGITFQVSIVADLLVVVSFHIYSICALAARLYNFQISALIALWRLFLGRKKNPLRGRVDSFKYSPEQLFIGTLGFTILLFLLPTTLIYYIVFTFMRILIVAFWGFLLRIRYLVHSLPVYSTILWVLGSPKVTAGIRLIPRGSPSGGSNCLVFYAKLVSISWWESNVYYKPDIMEKPQEFRFVEFVYSLLRGEIQ